MVMKIAVVGIPGIPAGKHNLRDARLDQADKLVEAKKKAYAQVDVVGEDTTEHRGGVATQLVLGCGHNFKGLPKTVNRAIFRPCN